ncbi:hypothetical protein FKM82_013019 [Ascaphus truei]
MCPSTSLHGFPLPGLGCPYTGRVVCMGRRLGGRFLHLTCPGASRSLSRRESLGKAGKSPRRFLLAKNVPCVSVCVGRERGSGMGGRR